MCSLENVAQRKSALSKHSERLGEIAAMRLCFRLFLQLLFICLASHAVWQLVLKVILFLPAQNYIQMNYSVAWINTFIYIENLVLYWRGKIYRTLLRNMVHSWYLWLSRIWSGFFFFFLKVCYLWETSNAISCNYFQGCSCENVVDYSSVRFLCMFITL